jgi:hypothetical protein
VTSTTSNTPTKDHSFFIHNKNNTLSVLSDIDDRTQGLPCLRLPIIRQKTNSPIQQLKMKFSLCILSLLACSVAGFAPSHSGTKMLTVLQATSEDGAADTRRNFMTKSVATASTLAAGMGVLAPSPANAVKGADKVNSMLKA